ncbi:fibronectin type III domain-containing protein [Corallococcus sp. M34]|uniref:fibronectin type III domain-containing protein n=1 Tax=Citreicoccus inhibens TaxID=2849499 RepID=UPI001315AC52|nr:fibronectin type III domain-containing protein [Citreicoccus inhibens]MBU8899116.1 fibronectin type III domain-containing protein [Citreicoccus inhibens]
MRRCLGFSVVGMLVALGGGTACGDGTEVPANNAVVVPHIEQAGAPESLTVTAGDSRVSLSWNAPASEGGGHIVGYTVWVFEEGKAARSLPVPGRGTTAEVTGLVNGRPYTFCVAATNSLGDGPQSARSAAVRPRVVPNAPRDITDLSTNQKVVLSWLPPEPNGMPIVSYTVTVIHRATNKDVATQTVTELTATFTGLTNGVEYLARVVANNEVVGGTPLLSAVFHPRTIPSVAIINKVVFLHDDGKPPRIRLEFAVADTGGGDQLGFGVYIQFRGADIGYTGTGDHFVEQPVYPNDPGTYRFVVNAFNEAGQGPSAEAIEVTPYP